MRRLNIRLENTSRLLAILIAIFSTASGTAFGQIPGKSKVDVVGSFTNMRFTDEHAYGYAVELWRHEKSLIGLFLASEGLQGDTPAGVLEKVTFDANTGALSFEAKLSTGVVYSKEHDGVPSRDLFRFTGVIKKGQVRGRLERFDMLDPHSAPKPEEIVLRRELSTSAMRAFADYASWKAHVDSILEFRGPKW